MKGHGMTWKSIRSFGPVAPWEVVSILTHQKQNENDRGPGPSKRDSHAGEGDRSDSRSDTEGRDVWISPTWGRSLEQSRLTGMN